MNSRVFTALSETSKRRYIYLCNMRTNVSRWSKAAVDYFGLPGEFMEDAGSIWEEFIHPDDREIYHRDIQLLFSGESLNHELEYRARNREGNYVICTCRGRVLRGENGEPDLFVGTITNHGIVDYVDATTHLYNIYEFMNEMQRLKEADEPMMVMMLGINKFRNINDIYGYAFGNKVLKAFAVMLNELVRGRGMVYRMDGTKFAICIQQMNREAAEALYARIQQLGRTNIVVENRHIPLSISGGAMIAENSHIGEYSIRGCLAYAQKKSKREGHSNLVFFSNEQAGDDMKSVKLYETIRQCVLRGCEGFYLCYQPLVRVEDGQVIGMEALLRWHHDAYGDLAPGQFIQWLEKDECFFELGNWILRQALTDGLEIVKKQPDFVVNVNVSYTQFEQNDFRDSLMEILQETGFPPENLYIELTERCEVTDLLSLRDVLDFFRGNGIKIALDDFGTGSASLNLLRKLPINCLKIDRSFISNIRTNQTDEVIVEMIIESANRLGMSVCLEGVENAEIRDYVKKYKVTNHQGYYYSRPVRIEKFKELLTA